MRADEAPNAAAYDEVPCPQGRTDYEACFAPFRYCPVKGCGRVQPDAPGARWRRLAETVRAAKAEFDTLPSEEQAALRAHMQEADEAGAALVAGWWDEKPDLCLREVVVTSGTYADPGVLESVHVLCMRPLPCDNPHHKPNAGWANV